MRTAATLKFGESAKIDSIDLTHPSSRRLLESGFTPGQSITMITKSLFDDPLAFSIRGTMIAVRRNEAETIKVL